jgi:hypothetical protein
VLEIGTNDSVLQLDSAARDGLGHPEVERLGLTFGVAPGIVGEEPLNGGL